MAEDTATIDPSLFETDFNLYVNKSEQKHDPAKGQVNYHMVCRVDSRHFDKVMGLITPIHRLKTHGIQSRDEWMESVTENVKSKFTFDGEFKDHQLKLKVSGKIIGAFGNVKLTTFQFDPAHTNLSLHIICYDTTGAEIGKVIDVMGGNLHATFKRADHWSKQEGLGLDKGDADKQVEMTEDQKQTAKEIERAKDVANKRNTDKVKGRTKEAEAVT